MEDRKKMQKIRVWVCIVVLAVFAALWFGITNAPVEYKAPPRLTLPNPNAYDTYVRAAQSLVCKDQIWEALSTTPAAGSEFPLLYRNSKPLPPGVPAAGTLHRLYNSAEKRAVVKANAKALSIFREGLGQDFLLPPRTDSNTLKLSGIRNVSWLVALESIVHRESGENGKAMTSCLDGMKMANDIAVGGNIFPALVSEAMQVVVRNEVWDIVDSLSLTETQEAITRLNNIMVEAFPFRSIMIEEKDTLLSMSQELLNSNDWRKQYVAWPPAYDVVPDKYSPYYWLEYAGTFRQSRRGLFLSVESDMEKQIKASDLSYPEYCRMNIPESNKITREIFPAYKKFRFKYEYNRCMNDFLLLQLSLHSYKLEHGKYPAKLDELVPKYVNNAPMDPFATGAEYKYNRTSNSYILYSIGPDLKDDGGKAIIHSYNPKKHWVNGSDIGDIVAGYNI